MLLNEIIVRNAVEEDCVAIHKLIQERVTEDNLTNDFKLTAEDLARDGFQRSPKLFRAIVAEVENKVVGMAVYYIIFSTWSARCIQVSSFSVNSAYQHLKIASKLFLHLVKITLDEGCIRIDMNILKTSPTMKMLMESGMRDVTSEEDWLQFSVDKPKMLEIVQREFKN